MLRHQTHILINTHKAENFDYKYYLPPLTELSTEVYDI